MTNTQSESNTPRKATSKSPSTPTEVVERGLQFLRDYFTQVGAEIAVSVHSPQLDTSEKQPDEQECIYQLHGDLKPLKRNPQYLSSLTRLTSIAMSSGGRQRYLCQLDPGGTLAARKALLQVIAADAAEVAKHTHKRAIIEGLSSGERRQIHQHIGDDQEVETLSDGEDEFRYLMVAIKT